MFDWFKKKNKVEFYTSMPELLQSDSLVPGTAREDLIAVMKKSKNYAVQKSALREVNIKNCPGIIQYMKQGYIVRAWQDILIEADATGDTFFYECASSKKTSVNLELPDVALGKENDIAFFDRTVFYDFFPRKNTLKNVLKINTPWYVKLPPGYAALIVPVWYDNEDRFSTIPGILETDYLETLNIQIYWHALGKKEIIEAGTPLAKIIPIKLENWSHEVRAINRKDVKKLSAFQVLYTSTFNNKWVSYKNKLKKNLNW